MIRLKSYFQFFPLDLSLAKSYSEALLFVIHL